MDLLARDFPLSSPEIECRWLDIEPNREILDREEHEVQQGESYDTPLPP